MHTPLCISPAMAVVGCGLACLSEDDAKRLEALILGLIREPNASTLPLVPRITDALNAAYVEP